MKVETIEQVKRVDLRYENVPMNRVFTIGTGGYKYLKLSKGTWAVYPDKIVFYEHNSFDGADYHVLPEGTQVIITT